MNYPALTLLLVCIQGIVQSNGYYYWKDYKTIIPSDAYSPGRDAGRKNVYIGRGLLLNEFPGLYTTTIYINRDVFVPIVGARVTNQFVEILCSTDPENFEWIPTNSTHFHYINTDNEIVRGGMENHKGILGIGRTQIEGETVIGKIMSEFVEANMWLVHNGNEKKAESYDLLTYKKNFSPKGNETYKAHFI